MKRCALGLTMLLAACGDGYEGEKPYFVSKPTLQDPTCEQYPAAISSEQRACGADDECPVPVSPCAEPACLNGNCVVAYADEGTADLCSGGRLCSKTGECCTSP